MKTFIITLLLTLSLNTHAYTVGGAYAYLINCTYGQYGYQYGYLGTYSVNGRIITVFFGNSYCPS